MEQRSFGPTQRNVAAIGQGTWQLAGRSWAPAIAALRRGLELGMTHIDTAEMYGRAEELIREAVAGRRDEVFLVSKVLPENASRRGTRLACERSNALPKGMFMAVNVSPLTTERPDLLALLAGCHVDHVVLEVTEHARVDDYPRFRRSIDRVRELGASEERRLKRLLDER